MNRLGNKHSDVLVMDVVHERERTLVEGCDTDKISGAPHSWTKCSLSARSTAPLMCTCRDQVQAAGARREVVASLRDCGALELTRGLLVICLRAELRGWSRARMQVRLPVRVCGFGRGVGSVAGAAAGTAAVSGVRSS